MLILSRKKSEKILIGDDITVVLLDVGAGRAVIGIDAPKDIRIDREEIRDRIEKGIPFIPRK